MHCLVCQVAMCPQAEEISRTTPSEVRGGRCFLQSSTDLPHEQEEQTICLACTQCRRMPAPDSYTNSVPRWCTAGHGGMPVKHICGLTDVLGASTVRASVRLDEKTAGNAGMLATGCGSS